MIKDPRSLASSELASWARALDPADIARACEALSEDPRRSAREAFLALQKRIHREEAEFMRLKSMFLYEEQIWSEGVGLIAGVDEAGRGPLAGPVVAAAVILRPGTFIKGLNDSKQLQEPVREELYEKITNRAVATAVGIRDARYIEEHNIARASFQAMRDALSALSARPEFVLVDGFRIPDLGLPQRHIIKGDALSCSIAAASIVAKVTRDRLLKELHLRYPAYGFAQNKGYSTKEHLSALDAHGLCPEHRRTFISVARAQMQFDSPDAEAW